MAQRQVHLEEARGAHARFNSRGAEEQPLRVGQRRRGQHQRRQPSTSAGSPASSASPGPRALAARQALAGPRQRGPRSGLTQLPARAGEAPGGAGPRRSPHGAEAAGRVRNGTRGAAARTGSRVPGRARCAAERAPPHLSPPVALSRVLNALAVPAPGAQLSCGDVPRLNWAAGRGAWGYGGLFAVALSFLLSSRSGWRELRTLCSGPGESLQRSHLLRSSGGDSCTVEVLATPAAPPPCIAPHRAPHPALRSTKPLRDAAVCGGQRVGSCAGRRGSDKEGVKGPKHAQPGSCSPPQPPAQGQELDPHLLNQEGRQEAERGWRRNKGRLEMRR